MLSMRKILLVNVFFVMLFSLCAAETILVPEKSLLFSVDKKEKNWQIKATVQREFYAEVIRKEMTFLPQSEVNGLFTDAYYLKIPGTQGLWYFPNITFKNGKNGMLTLSVDRIDSLMFLGIFIFVIGLAALAGYIRLESEKKKYLLPAALLLFYLGFAFWYVGYISNYLINPSDDIEYFNIASMIRNWDFTSMTFRYTIGFPILCLPFLFLFHLPSYLNFISVYMNFQTFFLIPGIFLVLYWCFNEKMGFSRIESFFTLLLWQILLFFYLPIWVAKSNIDLYIPETYYCNGCFALLGLDSFFIIKFIKLTWLGRNAMSDYAAFFLLVVLIYFSIRKSRSLIRFFVLSMVFGFLCLVRINCIFFAPLLAFIFYDSFSELWRKKQYYLYAVLCGAAGFMCVFVWQFVVNKIQFGSPFIWPYSLHKYAPDRGFVWHIFPYGFKFLFQTNYVYMILGISSLLFIPERKTRVLLFLWIFPLLLFFCGYPVVFNNAVRFILPLYPPLAAAIVINPVWKAAWNIRIKAALVVFCSCLLCKSNIFFYQFQPWNLGKCGISNNTFIIIQAVICLFCCGVIFSMRKELKADYANTIRHFRFLVLFTAVFFLGSVCIYIAGILVAMALVQGLWDTWNAIRQIYEKNRFSVQSLTE